MQRSSAAANTWAVTDGHAGNVRQAQALARALGRVARDCVLTPRAPWHWLAPRQLPAARHAFGPEFATALAAPPGLAIGCGRQSALATRLLRNAGARAVQILDPRIDPRHWDLVIAPAHDRLHGDNVILMTGSLHPVDDLWLADARKAFPALGQLPHPHVALLLGGTSAHAVFDVTAFDALATQLETILRRDGGSVLATASRRTPRDLRQRLRARFGHGSNLAWCDDGDGVNPYPGLLGWADRIVCTADSVNMLSEACATNAAVYVAGAHALHGRPRRFVDGLVASGRVRVFGDALDTWEITPLRETARVAAEVQARLGLPG